MAFITSKGGVPNPLNVSNVGIIYNSANANSGILTLTRGVLVTTPQTFTITSAGMVLSAQYPLLNVRASIATVLVSTPSIDYGLNGQVLRLRNIGTTNITLTHDADGSTTGVSNSGGAAVVLHPGNVVDYQFFNDIGMWQQVSVVI